MAPKTRPCSFVQVMNLIHPQHTRFLVRFRGTCKQLREKFPANSLYTLCNAGGSPVSDAGEPPAPRGSFLTLSGQSGIVNLCPACGDEPPYRFAGKMPEAKGLFA